MTTRLLAAAENHTHTLFSLLLLLLLDGESNRSTSRKRRKSRLPRSTVVVTTTNQHFSRLLPQHTGWGAERFFFHLFSCAGCSSFLRGTSFFFHFSSLRTNPHRNYSSCYRGKAAIFVSHLNFRALLRTGGALDKVSQLDFLLTTRIGTHSAKVFGQKKNLHPRCSHTQTDTEKRHTRFSRRSRTKKKFRRRMLRGISTDPDDDSRTDTTHGGTE